MGGGLFHRAIRAEKAAVLVEVLAEVLRYMEALSPAGLERGLRGGPGSRGGGLRRVLRSPRGGVRFGPREQGEGAEEQG
ncbi:MAG: hypothetical protein ACP5VX_05995 [Thermogladius sp.]